jgi:hypothetical protein
MATAAQVLPRPRRRVAPSLAGGRAAVREVYFTKRIDNSRVVRDVDISKLRACFMLAVPLGLTFVLLFVFAWLHFQCVRYGYEIEDLQQKQAAWSEQNRELRAQEESALQQVAPTAQLELGMTPVDPAQVIRITQSGDGLPASDEPQLAEAQPAPKPPLPRTRR